MKRPPNHMERTGMTLVTTRERLVHRPLMPAEALPQAAH